MDWRRRERDLDAELRAHLEMAAQDARERGESVEAARAAAGELTELSKAAHGAAPDERAGKRRERGSH